MLGESAPPAARARLSVSLAKTSGLQDGFGRVAWRLRAIKPRRVSARTLLCQGCGRTVAGALGSVQLQPDRHRHGARAHGGHPEGVGARSRRGTAGRDADADAGPQTCARACECVPSCQWQSGVHL